MEQINLNRHNEGSKEADRLNKSDTTENPENIENNMKKVYVKCVDGVDRLNQINGERR